MLEGAEASRLIKAVTEQAYNAVLITDGALSSGGPSIVYCNPAFCRMTGYERSELLGRSPRLLQGPDTDPAVIDSLRQALRQGRFWEGSTVNYRQDGEPYFVNWSISPIVDDCGQVSHFVSIQQDITSRVRAETERDMLIQALNQAHDPVLVTDRDARIVFANAAFEELTGYRTEEVIGQTPALLSSGEQGPDFYRTMWQTLNSKRPFQARFINRRKDGSRYYVEQSIAPVLNKGGSLTHFISTSWQVDELVEREKALVDMATRDKLTGLLTRRAGDDALLRAHQEHLGKDTPLSVIICDIDHFKQVNDRHGHLSGDRVIREVAGLIERQLRAGDPAIRWGGEEFLIMVQASSGVALGLAERLRSAVEHFHDPKVGQVTLSLGVAEILPGESIEQLLGRADGALYRAKRSGRNCTISAAGN
ncbi:sensor domain-containing diguanylate cyclase [Halomonas mongoliensis]|uniref:sensor domain-containing diguanylate cyclase n=1 Tax=Halomonas mongoliensis TaxID=321265 RepID=UPI00403B287A